MTLCSGCKKPIFDQFLLSVLNQSWHAACLQCSDCRLGLSDRCFTKEGRLYCRTDFFRRFGTKCSGCSEGISPSDLVRRMGNSRVYHLGCFTCAVCRVQLTTGDELLMIDGGSRFVCTADRCRSLAAETAAAGAEMLDGAPPCPDSASKQVDSTDKALVLLQSSTRQQHRLMLHQRRVELFNGAAAVKVSSSFELNNNSNSSSSNNSNNCAVKNPSESSRNSAEEDFTAATADLVDALDEQEPDEDSDADEEVSSALMSTSSAALAAASAAGIKRRGPRTTIKAKQLETLKAAFSATPKPTRHVREQLAQDTGLSMRVIQVWFQNRRSKERRLKQLSAMGARRGYFRNQRRIRALRGADADDSGENGDLLSFARGYFGSSNCFNSIYPAELYHAAATAATAATVPDGCTSMPMRPPPPVFLTETSEPRASSQTLVQPTGKLHYQQSNATSADSMEGRYCAVQTEFRENCNENRGTNRSGIEGVQAPLSRLGDPFATVKAGLN